MVKSKEEGKVQESIQSSTTPDQDTIWESDKNRNEELSSMLSFEISHLSSTTSIEEVICRLRHQFFRHLVSSCACSSIIKRNFAAKLFINAGE